MKRIAWVIGFLMIGLCSATAQIELVTQEKANIQLGKIKERRLPLEQNFFFCNEGHQPLYIQRILSTCGCKVIAHSRDSITYDEMGYVSVYLTPPFKAGPFHHEIYVYTNLGTLRYSLSGEFLNSTHQHQNYTAIPPVSNQRLAERGRKRK